MIKKILSKYSNRFVSRWIVLTIDIFIVAFSFLLAIFVRSNLDINSVLSEKFEIQFAIILLVKIIGFLLFRSYAGIIRHTSIADAINIFKALNFSLGLLLSANITASILNPEVGFIVSNSIVVVDYLFSLFLLIASRLVLKAAYYSFVEGYKKKTKVAIFGAGRSGRITKHTLFTDGKTDYDVVAFIDDNDSVAGKTIEGLRVYSSSVIGKGILKELGIEEVIISIQNISADRKRAFVDQCLLENISIKSIPPVSNWINGELSAKQIRKVRIEDLLEREQINLDKENIKAQVFGRRLLITGAAGSIGSEISRQLVHYKPSLLVLLDQAETPLYELEIELNKLSASIDFEIEYVIADITNLIRMEAVFEKFRPEIVFHAAAYKHVPMMENNPSEAVSVNVFGTKNIADLSIKYKTEKFVMVSTDKAVNPTNVMGATKRVAEVYIQSFDSFDDNHTKFITTRFGNVLGSNGSVIPLFKKQIENGGPVTVTHPDITRYFMTIPEACQLVLEAGSMGHGGEIFIFDMGESVKILDVAKKMILLSGLTQGKDIEIKFTGLRPGEKLYEELLNESENTIPTHHSKIMIAKVSKVKTEVVLKSLTELKNAYNGHENNAMVSIIKEIVPEFLSKNSIYEKLDQPVVKAYLKN